MAEMNELKKQVLVNRLEYLSDELGDPGRYFPALRAKGILSPEDCEKIKAKVTNRERVHDMIEIIKTRHSERDGHAMDVLVEALRRQRVQAHIAGELLRALARAKDRKKGVASSPSPPMTATTSAYNQAPLPSVSTPNPGLSTPSNCIVVSSPQFDIHPQHGALPPNCPKTPQRTPAQPTDNVDARFGLRPGTPPPRRGNFPPTQEGASPGVGEVTTGMSDLRVHLSSSTGNVMSSSGSFPSHYHNGGAEYHHASGQALDRRSSDFSYTTTSGTVYTTSTEQSGPDYEVVQGEFRERPEGQGEYREGVASRGRMQEMEAKVEEVQSILKKKELEIIQLRKESAHLDADLREMTDKYEELQKQHSLMCEKVRQYSLSGQKQMLESYNLGRKEEGDLEEVSQLRRELQEKDQQITMLSNQVERYQQDNQQLQLSLSSTGNSSRPQHLAIGSQTSRSSTVHRAPYAPSRFPYQCGVGDTPAPVGMTPSAGITPMRSQRVGDNLNQHNIHLQQSWGSSSRRDSPAYSPGKEPSSKGPSMFSPGRESGVKGGLFSPGREGAGKRLSGSSGETPMGDNHFKSSSSSLNSSESKGSAGITLQTTPNAEHSTMV